MNFQQANNQPVIEAAGIVLFTSSAPVKFLLMKHADRWDLPKGHAEPNESILQTALRETHEETGIPAESIAVDSDFRYIVEYAVRGKKRGDYHKRVTYFLGRVPRPLDIRLTEHVGYQWWDWPVTGSIQTQTIDPLLAKIADYFTESGQAVTRD